MEAFSQSRGKILKNLEANVGLEERGITWKGKGYYLGSSPHKCVSALSLTLDSLFLHLGWELKVLDFYCEIAMNGGCMHISESGIYIYLIYILNMGLPA